MKMKQETFDPENINIANAIMKAKTPTEVKRLGRRIDNYDENIWNNIRYNHMIDALKYKFNQNEDIKYKMHKLNKTTTDKLIIYSSVKWAKKDAYDRNSAVEKIKKHVGCSVKNKLAGVLRKSYVNLTEDSCINIDEDKLKEAAKFDGYFAIQTNISNCDPEEILANYRGLYQIEQTFRISKYNLKIRPVFHDSPHRVKAHFAICYVALILLRTIEFKTKQKKEGGDRAPPLPQQPYY